MGYYLSKLKLVLLVFCFTGIFFVCKRLPEKTCNQFDDNKSNQCQSDSLHPIVHTCDSEQTGKQHLTLANGRCFVISGDFDGNGTKETLTEHFYSLSEKSETSKWNDSIDDYDQLIKLIITKDAYSFVTCDTRIIDTLHTAPGGNSFGLAYLKNEGDLNGDGTDDVSYVVNFTDWSELNTWYIMTCKNGSWKKLYTFPIWDWQLPAIPHLEYAVSGKEIVPTCLDVIFKTTDDSNNFEGLVKKISTGKIQVVFRNENSEVDTMIVDLK